ncbi:MAG: thermonuclease family protein [Nitrosomonas sp.]|nr:thermonuclease family protein [Nitrosomonas sp.]MDP1951401.1 thermonuclease family protein [Nitrosomonas sp.]
MLLIKKHYFIGIILGSLFSQVVWSNQVFRTEDLQGRITYSDKPAAGSIPVEISVSTNTHHRSLHQVASVYDGDTIVLKNGDRVRLLGINTPEIESRFRVDEPGGIAAKMWLKEQLENKKVYLEYDQEKLDRYKRLLAHLYLPSGKHLNAALIEKGFAAVNIIPPNLRHTKKLIQAQQQAEKQALGIWSMPLYQPRPLTQITRENKGWQRYIGKPESIKRNRKYSRLIFNEQTDVRIANDSLYLFPALESYLGKSIEIRGWVSRSKNKYSILIHHPSALILR